MHTHSLQKQYTFDRARVRCCAMNGSPRIGLCSRAVIGNFWIKAHIAAAVNCKCTSGDMTYMCWTQSIFFGVTIWFYHYARHFKNRCCGVITLNLQVCPLCPSKLLDLLHSWSTIILINWRLSRRSNGNGICYTQAATGSDDATAKADAIVQRTVALI